MDQTKKSTNLAANKPLNHRRKQFVKEYIIDLNGAQAALRAGYCRKNPENARHISHRLLGMPQIQDLIQERMDARTKRVELKADNVLRELWLLAMSDLGDFYDDKGKLKPMHMIPPELRRAIAGITVFEEFAGFGDNIVKRGETKGVKLWDKPKSLELLAKHFKLLTEKHEITGKDGERLTFVEFASLAEKKAKDEKSGSE